MKTYKIYLDIKNQKVLIKKLYNQKMSTTETKRLYRTIRIIERKYYHIQITKKNEKRAKELFL